MSTLCVLAVDGAQFGSGAHRFSSRLGFTASHVGDTLDLEWTPDAER